MDEKKNEKSPIDLMKFGRALLDHKEVVLESVDSNICVVVFVDSSTAEVLYDRGICGS